MANIVLDVKQHKAIQGMKNGCILCGDVGSGKSRTALAYYYIQNGGVINQKNMRKKPLDLYIITTAKKRDNGEWEEELTPFSLSTQMDLNYYNNNIVIDSWNNIKKYKDVTDAFFIFDEQRLVGSGAWVKAFLKMAKKNQWILLSATPGDTWYDYIPVFVANGFYKNRTEFLNQHAVYSRFTKFPKIEKYVGTGKLAKLKQDILVDIEFKRHTEQNHIYPIVDYDRDMYKEMTKTRWDPFKNKPIENAGALCYLWRKIANSDLSRIFEVEEICSKHDRVIIFYNFDYELDLLKSADYGRNVIVAEYNGHIHDDVPKCKKWVYLVQYTAGCEGWNCITTDTMIFYSQNYSYKVMKQAAGRIDRRNTKYRTLYYYHLISHAPIDIGIKRVLKLKKNFNEATYVKSAA